MINMCFSSYFRDQDFILKPKDNMHYTNARGSKKIWAPKVKKLNYDVDMLNNSNSKCDIDSYQSNHLMEEKNIFSYFTPTRGEDSYYSNNIDKFVGYDTIGKSHNPTVDLL